MYSFYGGRPGNSFVIVTTYRSIDDMVAAFQQGPAYTAVHYDEYVMINAANKNDPHNGELYRRGYDFTNDMGGAEFVGTIAGPAGPAPILELTSIEEIENKEVEENIQVHSGEGTYTPIPGKFETDVRATRVDPETGQVIEITDQKNNPVYESGYNDKIQWKYCSIRDENGEDTTVYVGFAIPYPVIDFDSTSVSPYYNNHYIDNTSIERVDDNTHPFYEKWNINIPKGVKGNSISDFKVEEAPDDIGLQQQYDGYSDDRDNHRKIITYKQYDYDNYEDGNPIKKYLGDYNMIDHVDSTDDGDITIHYTHDDPTEIHLQSIKSVDLNKTTGQLTFKYNQPINNNENKEKIFYLPWVKNIDIDENGEIKIYYTNNGENNTFDYFETVGPKLNWITGASMNNKGEITINYKNSPAQTFPTQLKWIRSVNVDKKSGTIKFIYNEGQGEDTFSNIIKNIENIDVNDINGTLTINYNYGDPYIKENLIKWVNVISFDNTTGQFSVTYNNGITQNLGKMPLLNDISMNGNGSLSFNYSTGTKTTNGSQIQWPNTFRINPETQKLELQWNKDAGTTSWSTVSDDPINYILETGINAAGHLLVKYSDPVRQNNGGITFNGTSGWTDVGSVLLSDIEYNGDSVTNLNWTGMGMLSNPTQSGGNKIVKFTLVPTQLLRHTLTNVTINAGTITVVQRGQSEAITGLNSADLTQVGANVTKTFAGIDFEIPSGVASDSSTAPVFVDIIIEGLSLTFS